MKTEFKNKIVYSPNVFAKKFNLKNDYIKYKYL